MKESVYRRFLDKDGGIRDGRNGLGITEACYENGDMEVKCRACCCYVRNLK